MNIRSPTLRAFWFPKVTLGASHQSLGLTKKIAGSGWESFAYAPFASSPDMADTLLKVDRETSRSGTLIS